MHFWADVHVLSRHQLCCALIHGLSIPGSSLSLSKMFSGLANPWVLQIPAWRREFPGSTNLLLRRVGRGQQWEVDALEHCEVINDQQHLKNGKFLIKNMKIIMCCVDSLE